MLCRHPPTTHTQIPRSLPLPPGPVIRPALGYQQQPHAIPALWLAPSPPRASRRRGGQTRLSTVLSLRPALLQTSPGLSPWPLCSIRASLCPPGVPAQPGLHWRLGGSEPRRSLLMGSPWLASCLSGPDSSLGSQVISPQRMLAPEGPDSATVQAGHRAQGRGTSFGTASPWQASCLSPCPGLRGLSEPKTGGRERRA